MLDRVGGQAGRVAPRRPQPGPHRPRERVRAARSARVEVEEADAGRVGLGARPRRAHDGQAARAALTQQQHFCVNVVDGVHHVGRGVGQDGVRGAGVEHVDNGLQPRFGHDAAQGGRQRRGFGGADVGPGGQGVAVEGGEGDLGARGGGGGAWREGLEKKRFLWWEELDAVTCPSCVTRACPRLKQRRRDQSTLRDHSTIHSVTE